MIVSKSQSIELLKLLDKSFILIDLMSEYFLLGKLSEKV